MENNQKTEFEGNYYDKYNSSNFIVRGLMKGFFASLNRLIDLAEIRGGIILEAGCGEGIISEHVFQKIKQERKKNIIVKAFDISERIIECAKNDYPEFDFRVHDIYEALDESQYFDLVICSEVLEHLELPKKAVLNLMQYSDEFIFSVPHEPIWRTMNMARGRYLADWGNTPGHIQHFSKKGFKRMMEECGLMVLEYETPLPWLMVYCKKRS